MSDLSLDILWGLVLGNGKSWGEVAIPQQRDDAVAIFSDERPHLHFITRPRGGSKPLALSTPLPTPTGWTSMGDVKKGDWLFDDQGHPTQVLGVGEIRLGDPCYRVRFADGESLVTSADHEWVAQDRQIRANRGRDYTVTVTTQELHDSLTYGSRGDKRWGIPMGGAFDLPECPLPLDPYVLGAWLGDGNSDSSRITVGDEDRGEMATFFTKAGMPFVGELRKPEANCATYRFGNPLGTRSNGRGPSQYDSQRALHRLGVLRNKHIPKSYLRGSRQQRLELLRGLMDTDGHQSHSLSYFNTTSSRLAEDVAELVVSLGWKAWRSESPAMLYGRQCGTAYRVGIRATICPFRLARKVARWNTPEGQAPRHSNRTVVAVDPVESVPVRCIKVSAESHLYLAGNGAIPTHNTTDIAGMAIAWLIADAPVMARGYVVAANAEQAAHVIDAAASFRARTAELEGLLTVENEKIIAPGKGAWIRVLSLSDSGAWGLREARFLIADEFCQWPQTRAAKRVYEALRSTVQKEVGCRLVILSSSGEPTHWSRATFDEALREMGHAKEQNRPSMWRVSEMPGPVPWQDPDEIDQLRNELSPSAFDRLVLNIWSQDEDRAISEEDFDAAAQKYRLSHKVPTGLRGYGVRLREPQPDLKYLMSVDIGIYNDSTVMCIAHKEPIDSDKPKGLQRVVVDHLERWSGSKKRPVQLQDIEEWIVAHAAEYNRARVVADPDQFIGNIQSLNRRGVRASAFLFGATTVGQIASALVQAFRNRQIWVPDYKGLRDELISVRLRESSPGVTRLTHDRERGHDDQAVAIGLVCHELLGKYGFGASFRTFMQRDREKQAEELKTEDRRFFRAVQAHQREVQSSRERVGLRRRAEQDSCHHMVRPGEVRCLKCGLCWDESLSVWRRITRGNTTTDIAPPSQPGDKGRTPKVRSRGPKTRI